MLQIIIDIVVASYCSPGLKLSPLQL